MRESLKDRQTKHYFVSNVLDLLNIWDRELYFIDPNDIEVMRMLIEKYRGVLSGEEHMPGIPMSLFDNEEE